MALVSFYEQMPHSDEAYRNYFKHLAEVGEHKKIIAATSLAWMKQSWKDLRSLDETKENLLLALEACVQMLSLSEFVRIAFLKAQFDRLAWNLEQSGLDFPLMLLKAGETANSLRMIWDGDFVLVSKQYFAFYLGQFFLKTGHHLDEAIIRQGLNKSLAEEDSEDLVTVFQALALVKKDVKKLFAEIDDIKWLHTDRHSADYIARNFTAEENATANFDVKQKVIDHLSSHRQFEKLHRLLKEVGDDEDVKIVLQTALVHLLVETDKPSALRMLASIDFPRLNDKEYVELMAACSNYLTEQELRHHFPHRALPVPALHEKVVENQGMNYAIHQDILDLFTSMKPLLLFQPDEVSRLRLRASALPQPARNLYAFVFFVAEVWHKTAHATLPEPSILHLAQQALRCLYQPRSKEFRTRNYGLFDMNNDTYFISRSIKHLFVQLFQLCAGLLSPAGLEKLADAWLSLEQTEDGFTHYTTAWKLPGKFIQASPMDNRS